jgi:hypothetical protein
LRVRRNVKGVSCADAPESLFFAGAKKKYPKESTFPEVEQRSRSDTSVAACTLGIVPRVHAAHVHVRRPPGRNDSGFRTATATSDALHAQRASRLDKSGISAADQRIPHQAALQTVFAAAKVFLPVADRACTAIATAITFPQKSP